MNETRARAMPLPIEGDLHDTNNDGECAQPALVDARERLMLLEIEREERILRLAAFKATGERLKQLRESAIVEMTRLDDLRPEIVLGAFLSGDGMSGDDEIRRSIKAKKLEINRIDLALPLLQKRINAAQAEIDLTAQLGEASDNKLHRLLDETLAKPAA